MMPKKKVGIIDYGAGNLGSIYNAIKYLDVQTKIISYLQILVSFPI